MKEDPTSRGSRNSAPTEMASRLASAIRTLSNGELAELRRADLDVPPPAFWKVAAESAPDEVASFGSTDTILHVRLARTLAKSKADPGGNGYTLGRAAAKAGVHELRIDRLLNADGETYEKLLEGAVDFIAGREVPVSAASIGVALIAPTEKVRRQIAAGYYLAATSGTEEPSPNTANISNGTGD